MSQINATTLAQRLNLSKARISQYVAEGKLDGCYAGDGRSRRFDLAAVATALNRQLDLGQMLGNGSTTRQALRAIDEDDGRSPPTPPKPRDGAVLPDRDPDRYELARIQKAEEEVRRLRRLNEEAEGTVVLAAEARQQTARAIVQEVAEFEMVLRDSARRVADRLGVDFRTVRQILQESWREHRTSRSAKLGAEADASVMTADEIDADI